MGNSRESLSDTFLVRLLSPLRRFNCFYFLFKISQVSAQKGFSLLVQVSNIQWKTKGLCAIFCCCSFPDCHWDNAFATSNFLSSGKLDTSHQKWISVQYLRTFLLFRQQSYWHKAFLHVSSFQSFLISCKAYIFAEDQVQPE